MQLRRIDVHIYPKGGAQVMVAVIHPTEGVLRSSVDVPQGGNATLALKGIMASLEADPVTQSFYYEDVTKPE